MKWIRKKILKWLDNDGTTVGIHSAVEHKQPMNDPVLNFRIYSAENGKVLEFLRYDRNKGETKSTIYILTTEDMIEEKVSKCLKMELLR